MHSALSIARQNIPYAELGIKTTSTANRHETDKAIAGSAEGIRFHARDIQSVSGKHADGHRIAKDKSNPCGHGSLSIKHMEDYSKRENNCTDGATASSVFICKK